MELVAAPATMPSTARTGKRPGSGRILLWASLIVFSGAFIELAIFGNNFRTAPSRTAVILNSATFLPLYAWSIVAVFLSRRSRREAIGSMRLPILVAALALFSSLWAIDPTATLREAVQLSLSLVVAMALICRLTPQTFLQSIAQALAFILTASVLAVYLLPSYGVMNVPGFSNLAGIPQGVFSHKNKFAEMATVGLFVAIAARKQLSFRLFALLLTVSLIAILISQSAAKTGGAIAALPAVWMLGRM